MRLLLPLCLFFFSCCQDTKEQTSEHSTGTVVQPGIVVAADSVRIQDPLNETYFSVKVLTNERSREGSYDIKARYGHNDAFTTITFPKGGSKDILPALKRGDSPNEMIVGFYFGGERQQFYEYFLVRADRGSTEMKYIRGYTFE